MMRPPDKQKPAALQATGSEVFSKCLAAFEEGNTTPNAIDLQAARLCRRFAISLPVAHVVAFHAFGAGRAAA